MINQGDSLTKQDLYNAIQNQVRAVVKSEIDPLYKLMTKLNDDISEVADDVNEIKQSVKVIARRFVSIDKVSADTAQELQEIASD